MKRTAMPVTTRQKLVVIGNGMAAYKFCEKFVSYRLHKKFELTVFGEEPHPAYDRVNLTKFLTEKATLTLVPASWYKEQGIRLITQERIVNINRQDKRVITAAGVVHQYDKLIFATGSRAFIPPIEGTALPGVFAYRTLDDLAAIREYMEVCSSVTVIGGGILGLEAARAMTMAGKETVIIERAGYLMPRQLDQVAGAVLLKEIQSPGLKVLLNKQLMSVTKTTNGLRLHFSEGQSFDTDMVLFSAGIIPRDELAVAAGLSAGTRGGIIVNNHMQTADPNIYAIGECAEVHGKLWGLAAPCFEMAEVLAARLAGIFKVFRGDLQCVQLKVLETKVACISSEDGEQTGEEIVEEKVIAGVYKKISLSADKKRITAAMLVGDVSAYAALLQLVRSRSRLPDNPAELINGTLNTGSRIAAMPDNMMVCLCESVCKKVIQDAIIGEGITRLEQVGKSTRAGTGCETCRPLIEEMINYYGQAAIADASLNVTEKERPL